ncbi:MAG: phosphopyruvate hydratase [Candidatus Geothermincolia bacterium]
MSSISDIFAREILESRGDPTVEVDVLLSGGGFGRAAVPSGASTGTHEALELRDFGSERYRGRGTRTAVRNVNEIIGPQIIGMDADEQGDIDRALIELDGTPNKGNLGANAILGVSLAVARAAAVDHSMPLYQYIGGISARTLPVPMMNVINGGVQAGNNLDFQEFMLFPLGAPSYSEALRMGVETYHVLRDVLEAAGHTICIGDEGGYAPDLPSNEAALALLVEAIIKAGYEPGRDIYLAMDPAASQFFNDGNYLLKGEKRVMSSGDLIDYYEDIVARYPVISIEDGLAEEDGEAWSELTRRIGDRVQLVGDDLFVTSRDRLRRGIERGAANSVLIKVNQTGTLTETLETVALAKSAGYSSVISHRSGETEDTTISDLAVATGAAQIKAGAPCRGDRISKYNQLLRIEENLCDSAIFQGLDALSVKVPRPAQALSMKGEEDDD